MSRPTVGGGCILGATVTEAASADALEAAYGEFAQEARELFAHLQPQDGVHRRLGRHAERLEAPLPDGVHYPVFPPLGPQDRRTLWA